MLMARAISGAMAFVALLDAIACGNIACVIVPGASMPVLLLDIALSSQSLLAVYRGRANRILLTSRDGRRVNLPAHHLRPFLTHAGVYGSFSLEFNSAGELLSLRKISE
ncbi:MAG: hypothetical protein ACI9EB_001493 [Pseudomonas sp.]|jgi:hypothetical protein